MTDRRPLNPQFLEIAVKRIERIQYARLDAADLIFRICSRRIISDNVLPTDGSPPKQG